MIVVSKDDQLNEKTSVALAFLRNFMGDRKASRVFAAFTAISGLGNIIVVTFTAARVKQEIAKEGILPFAKFFGESLSKDDESTSSDESERGTEQAGDENDRRPGTADLDVQRFGPGERNLDAVRGVREQHRHQPPHTSSLRCMRTPVPRALWRAARPVEDSGPWVERRRRDYPPGAPSRYPSRDCRPTRGATP